MKLHFNLENRDFNSIFSMDGTGNLSNYINSSDHLVVTLYSPLIASTLKLSDITFFDDQIWLSSNTSDLKLLYPQFFSLLKDNSIKIGNIHIYL